MGSGFGWGGFLWRIIERFCAEEFWRLGLGLGFWGNSGK